MTRRSPAGRVAVLAVLLTACTPPAAAPDPADVAGPGAGVAVEPDVPSDASPADPAPPAAATEAVDDAASAAAAEGPGARNGAAPRPGWLGTRILPLAPDGFGVRLPTPPELTDRRLATPPPTAEAAAVAADGDLPAVLPVPAAVLARSTWHAGCPVEADELRYVVVRHVGFDGRDHVGELIAHRSVADAVADVFDRLHATRFPLEEVRVITPAELTAPPTGDGNVTSAFVCRAAVGTTRWSAHAAGLAVDVNPFHNPYVRGDLVLPELAGTYVDRGDVRPGMVVAGDAVTAAFAAAGWGWGGDWTGAARDPMHFSTTGR